MYDTDLSFCFQFVCSMGRCLFGEKCKLHSVPGGFDPSVGNDPNYGGKSLLCYKFYTEDGCVDGCPYAHGPEELLLPTTYIKFTDDMGPLPTCSFVKGLGPETCFGTTIKTTKSFCSPRSSTEALDTWLISRMSGAEISLEAHISDPSMLMVKLEGTLDEVELATNMVKDHVASVGPDFTPPPAFALPPNSNARLLGVLHFCTYSYISV